MKPNKKELYLSPEVKTFEVKIEGVICASPDYNYNGFGNEEEM